MFIQLRGYFFAIATITVSKTKCMQGFMSVHILCRCSPDILTDMYA